MLQFSLKNVRRGSGDHESVDTVAFAPNRRWRAAAIARAGVSRSELSTEPSTGF
jgi:hypothetical protein